MAQQISVLVDVASLLTLFSLVRSSDNLQLWLESGLAVAATLKNDSVPDLVVDFENFLSDHYDMPDQ